jgi:hypothetical protein
MEYPSKNLSTTHHQFFHELSKIYLYVLVLSYSYIFIRKKFISKINLIIQFLLFINLNQLVPCILQGPGLTCN